jgi:hypothetical protein
MENSKSTVVRLSAQAEKDFRWMIDELTNSDPKSRLNNSKLLSFIVVDFKDKYFERTKDRILLAHRDKRKDAKDKLASLSETELEGVINYLNKIKKGNGP